MKYYVVYDIRMPDTMSSIVVYHEDLEAVQEFIRAAKRSEYKIGRCQEKAILRYDPSGDKYLVQFGNSYIPAEYYIGADDIAQMEESDYKACIATLERVLEFKDVTHRKSIEKTIIEMHKLLEGVRDTVDLRSAKELSDNIRMMRESFYGMDVDEHHGAEYECNKE